MRSSGWSRVIRTARTARATRPDGALVAVATMIGAVTMSRVVTDPGLSAEILSAAEKGLAADQV